MPSKAPKRWRNYNKLRTLPNISQIIFFFLLN
nr:MAG TPA: hypothetical protein [Caudoviricetes sp.]